MWSVKTNYLSICSNYAEWKWSQQFKKNNIEFELHRICQYSIHIQMSNSNSSPLTCHILLSFSGFNFNVQFSDLVIRCPKPENESVWFDIKFYRTDMKALIHHFKYLFLLFQLFSCLIIIRNSIVFIFEFQRMWWCAIEWYDDFVSIFLKLFNVGIICKRDPINEISETVKHESITFTENANDIWRKRIRNCHEALERKKDTGYIFSIVMFKSLDEKLKLLFIEQQSSKKRSLKKSCYSIRTSVWTRRKCILAVRKRHILLQILPNIFVFSSF